MPFIGRTVSEAWAGVLLMVVCFAVRYGIEQYLDMMPEQNRLRGVGTALMSDFARVQNGERALKKAAEYAPRRIGAANGRR